MPNSYSELVPIINKDDQFDLSFSEIIKDLKFIVTNELFSFGNKN